ncbi:response regulator [uncultured Clostridium sp.]|uniref:response regulator n=1 Tax=uncultured Clostridium sp. TaxID=59620 RepID=UPI0025D8E9E9|nr:response regulator [uncultured Clostridium sp.]
MIKVLIVEDDPMVAFINNQYLKKIGNIEVLGPVSNEKEILSIIEKEEVDLMLLDVFLPEKNGLDILKDLRNNNYLVDVIVISAANSPLELREAFACGIVDYLIKPFQFERFEEAINKYRLKMSLLNTGCKIRQKDVDSLYLSNKMCELPKGLNKLTLEKIVSFLKKNINIVWTVREIAHEVNLSNVTVKKYMDYLEEIGEVQVEIAYGNVGRPEYKYTINN